MSDKKVTMMKTNLIRSIKTDIKIRILLNMNRDDKQISFQSINAYRADIILKKFFDGSASRSKLNKAFESEVYEPLVSLEELLDYIERNHAWFYEHLYLQNMYAAIRPANVNKALDDKLLQVTAPPIPNTPSPDPPMVVDMVENKPEEVTDSQLSYPFNVDVAQREKPKPPTTVDFDELFDFTKWVK